MNRHRERLDEQRYPVSVRMISGVLFYIVEILTSFMTVGGQQLTLIAGDIWGGAILFGAFYGLFEYLGRQEGENA